jgi:protoporphyrinogen oxidase
MDIGIIGAGITGLTAAYDLTKAGHTVTVYESRPYAGGLAAGFCDERWDWPLDQFYHHWFASDDELIALIDELGAGDRLFFPWPTTSMFYQGEIYPLDSPIPSLEWLPISQVHRALRVLQFKPLSFIDRLRVGLVAFYLTITRNWQQLERISADAWLRRMTGERAYEIWWKPLLISKFGEENYRDVNMAWIWARAYKRTAKLGYFTGGFQGFIDLLAAQVEAQGGSIKLEAEIQTVRHVAEGVLRLETAAGPIEHERVIATCSPQQMVRLAPGLSAEYVDQLKGLKSMGAIALILALKHPMTDGHYWINVPASEGLPFIGLIEHTNYILPEHYGGDHLVYCGNYLSPEHPYFDYTKEQLLEVYLPGLKAINPDFSPDWIRDTWLFSEKYAQPVPGLDHSRNIPALRTPIPGLWLADMSQVYPWDRGSNYAIEMARQVAREVVQEL